MQVIPVQSVPSQTLTVVLGNQTCSINVYQRLYGLYLDLTSNDVLILGGQICQNLNFIVRSLYLGFSGDLAFYDTQGARDPDYTGLGSRYQLLYLTAAEVATAQASYKTYVNKLAGVVV